MPGAGELNARWTFQQRSETVNGDRQGPWEDGFTVWAKVTWLRGTEAVMADRLEGRQPVVITVRDSAQARAIGTGWRAKSKRRSAWIGNITGASPAKEPGFIDILATIGGAQG